jgi:hypothetical protein
MEYTEDKIRDIVMRVIYDNLGKVGTFNGQGKYASFQIENEHILAYCEAEQSQEYRLPNGFTISHNSDILISAKRKNRDSEKSYISIEIKHRSAVTDQFKTRAFDMLHLKQTYGSRIYGIMLFVRADTGISFRQAEKISYPFDKFIPVEYSQLDRQDAWDELLTTISKILT